ncbi:MAG: LysR family transcriptional regulator, partial [Halioglobus sp.]
MSAHKITPAIRGEPVTQMARSEDWSDIHFAFHVARLGTLSAAAQVLDVHHSTVLRRVDSLETRLKTRLFHRHARGYTPTDAGKLLLKVAAKTQDEFDRMIGQLAGADE